MARSRIAQSVLAAAIFWLVACSLAVDTAEIDRGCASDQKLCGSGHCVAQSDPAYGCTRDHCEPCALTNAIPACDGELCVVSACLFGFDCQNAAGCPINTLVDRDHCGRCDVQCASDQSCRDGVCLAK